jgi:triacylglycerol lipase
MRAGAVVAGGSRVAFPSLKRTDDDKVDDLEPKAEIRPLGAPALTESRVPGSKRQAALNAVLGDYLERRGNALAIQMSFYHEGVALRLSAESLHAAHLDGSPRVVVLVHGLGQTEACWSFRTDPSSVDGPATSVTYGSSLRDELGLTPFYVRYNTGRRISQNGRDLALLLEQLVLVSPDAIADITLIGHSMGGLVIRSACHYGVALAHTWPQRLRRAFYLGSPHLGSPFEKAGNLATLVLGAIDNPVVRLVHEVADLRGAGIKDLRDGSLLDEDWQPSAAGVPGTRPPSAVPLPAGVAHYFVAGTLTQSQGHLATLLFGDALVRLPSALDPARGAGLPPEHWAILPGILHMNLSRSPEVYARIRAWFAEQPAAVDHAPPPGDSPRSAPAAGAHPVGERPAGAHPAADRSASEPGIDTDAERWAAYSSLLEDAVDRGATAIQRIQEDFTARPYDVLERLPPIEAPSRLVRSLHYAGLRTTYDVIRSINRASGVAVRAGIAWMKGR